MNETFSGSKPDFPARTHAPAGAPNVLIWVIDDAGFAHLHSYGGLIDTPSTDALARQGLRYNNFHTTALCSPSRASLLTGRNSHAVSVGSHSATATGYPGYWSRVPKSAATIAKVLQENGYATYALGKWDHLPTEDQSPAGPFTYWPTGQGFDHFYGFLGAHSDHYHPLLWADQTPVDPWRDKTDYYLTTDLADHAIQWLTTQKVAAPERPFFMYWATGAVHSPHHALRATIDKYRGRFEMGWDKAREQIIANQRKLGVVPANALLPPLPAGLPTWESLSAADKKIAARQMEVFAAELDFADHEFGRIVDTLKKLNEYDNTIIVVLSDNGASGEGGPEGAFNENQVANGQLANFSDNLKHYDAWGGPGTYPHYSAAWAQAGNTPFRYFKQTVHEGGTRDPLIISWPKRITAGGGIRSQYHHINDVMPTLLEMIGIAEPTAVDGVAQQRLDGISMLYTFDHSRAATQKGSQYFEMYGNRGIWVDGWMAVTVHNATPWKRGRMTPVEDDVWELYDLSHDFNELHDLASKQPGKLAELRKLFDLEARRNNVYPILPDFQSKDRDDTANLLKRTGGVFEYLGPVQRIPEKLAPPVLNRSFSITAQISARPDTNGVILALGGEEGGYVLYVDRGVPVYCYNYFGLDRFVLRSSAVLPAGEVTVRFEFHKADRNAGVGYLYLNDKLVSKGSIERTEPFYHSNNETFDIGRDSGSPVSPDYAGRDTFTGKIDRVAIKVDED